MSITDRLAAARNGERVRIAAKIRARACNELDDAEWQANYGGNIEKAMCLQYLGETLKELAGEIEHG